MTREGHHDNAGLRVGHVAGVTLTKWRRVWAERLPGVPLTVIEVAVAGQRDVLDNGDVDLCFVRLPLDRDGLHLIPLYDEEPVVWASKDHPVALFDAVTTADLAGETVLDDPDPAAIARVADGEAVLRVPLSVARTFSRRDLAHRPVTDAPATTVGLAWRTDLTNPWVEEFIGIVRGRTANSSRTAGERAARAAAAPQPQPRRPRGSQGRRGTGPRPGRRR